MQHFLIYEYQIHSTLMGISSILLVHPKDLPDVIKEFLKGLLDKICELTFKQKEKKEKKMVKGGEDEEEEEEDDENFDNNCKIAKKIIEDEDYDFEDDDNSENEDEIVNTVDTPISKVNEFVYLKNIFNRLNETNKEYYDTLINLLSLEQKKGLKEIFDNN